MPGYYDLVADRYRLAGILGVGGVAEVRRAWDTVLRRPVAIKLLLSGCDEADRRRFDNEIHTLAGLSHPGLVSVYDAGTIGPMPFVVLQLVDGSTLRDRLAYGPLPVIMVCELGRSLSEALGHVHTHGVVHRDVKPSNILRDRDGTVYLADFGLARAAGTTRLTRSDQFVGTAAYLAPEQVRGGEITSAVDVYALGLVLLECLTGVREYDGSAIEAAVARLHRRPLVPDHLPFELRRLLTLMTSPHPRQRPSAYECARILQAIGRSEAVGPITTKARVRQHPWRSRTQALLAAALASLLVAAGSTDAAHDAAPPVSGELLVTQQPRGPRADPVESSDSLAKAHKGVHKNKGGKGKPNRGKGKHGW
ncbi:serine/threonine-protein kinase [Lentzea nigeriaca]|uniref:serine/threonine-protein kinase n=1 Tax=Lentzea nigeriaca TaxID=1128665 RepID=UPI0019575FA1|nr:serine/threonine-protein kinase [Lentzea nigeriaca]MBM7864290.1 serine/threonine protein kinase [Lentzea nigeriaca]